MILSSNKKGLIYRSMGTMENHVWSIIARRMKHNHTCLSVKGGNNLAKILAKKCSGRLNEVSNKLKTRVFDSKIMSQIERDILSAGSISIKAGKGYAYPVKGVINKIGYSSGTVSRQMWNSISGV